MDIAAPGTYMLAEVDDDMLPNTWNVDQCIVVVKSDSM
jgi:hypothetical protein